eukprot:1389828-Amorphochlora_amoeboformis.AAC.1
MNHCVTHSRQRAVYTTSNVILTSNISIRGYNTIKPSVSSVSVFNPKPNCGGWSRRTPEGLTSSDPPWPLPDTITTQNKTIGMDSDSIDDFLDRATRTVVRMRDLHTLEYRGIVPRERKEGGGGGGEKVWIRVIFEAVKEIAAGKAEKDEKTRKKILALSKELQEFEEEKKEKESNEYKLKMQRKGRNGKGFRDDYLLFCPK